MNWRQSNYQWGGVIAIFPTPKIQVQNSAENVLAFDTYFFGGGYQNGILLIDYTSKGQTINAECYSTLMVQLKDILKETRTGSSSRVSRSCTIMRRVTGHLRHSALFTHPIVQIWHLRTTTCSLDRIKNWKVAIFLPSRRSLLLPETWLDGQFSDYILFYIFFRVAYKRYSNGLTGLLSFVRRRFNKFRVGSL